MFPVSLDELVNLTLDIGWQGVRHPHTSHVLRQTRSTIFDQRPVLVHEAKVFESDLRSTRARAGVLARFNPHPGETAGDAPGIATRAIHADTDHGIVIPSTAASHAVVHAEDPASARITDMRSVIDEDSHLI